MVWDDQREYIDWAGGLGGTGIFGHNYPPVEEAVQKQAGSAFHLPCVLEREVAGLLAGHLRYAEETRFCQNGSDATNGAIRLARAVTGRSVVIAFEGAYHGASYDWCCDQAPAKGVPTQSLIRIPWNRPKALEASLTVFRAAAVIFEIGADDPTPEMVEALNRVGKYGTILIADEVVTGFRLSLQGACGLFGIQPDLGCFGKAIGNGYPIAALCGKRDLMREFDLDRTLSPVFMSYTHSGNAKMLAAAKATLERIGPWEINYLWDVGAELMRYFTGKVVGQAPRSGFRFDSPERESAFWQHCAKEGVLFYKTNFPTLQHKGEILDRTLELLSDAFTTELDGDAPKALYSTR